MRRTCKVVNMGDSFVSLTAYAAVLRHPGPQTMSLSYKAEQSMRAFFDAGLQNVLPLSLQLTIHTIPCTLVLQFRYRYTWYTWYS